jgi:hypothetical protein
MSSRSGNTFVAVSAGGIAGYLVLTGLSGLSVLDRYLLRDLESCLRWLVVDETILLFHILDEGSWTTV